VGDRVLGGGQRHVGHRGEDEQRCGGVFAELDAASLAPVQAPNGHACAVS
jgi:hypothetical protein